MSRRLPQTSARPCLFFSLPLFLSLSSSSSSSQPPVTLPRPLSFPSATLEFFPNNGGHPRIPLSPVTQEPPGGDQNDAPPTRIMTNQTIGRCLVPPSSCLAIFEHVHQHFFSLHREHRVDRYLAVDSLCSIPRVSRWIRDTSCNSSQAGTILS